MSSVAASLGRQVVYPESDGRPMAENTKQFRWIVTIQGGLDAVFRHDPSVFVAGDLFWYPVEGDNKTCVAPDIFVVFGRPKGDRRSYLQWQEENIAPQVLFEIHSPGNRAGELTAKFSFYERYGGEEYYLYDPDTGALDGWIRVGNYLEKVPEMNGWVSPRLKVRFEIVDDELRLFGPDGKRFLTYLELVEQQEQEQRQREEAQQRAEQAQQRTEEAQQRTEEAQQRTEEALQRAERLAAKLRALGQDPDA
jgi:Uma2 family endonuclease